MKDKINNNDKINENKEEIFIAEEDIKLEYDKNKINKQLLKNTNECYDKF